LAHDGTKIPQQNDKTTKNVIMRQKWFVSEIRQHFYKFKGVFCPGKGFMVISVKREVYKFFKYIELCYFYDALFGGSDWSLCGDLHFSAAKWPAGCAD
jgi:hypothetical protein